MVRHILLLDAPGGELQRLGQVFREKIGMAALVHGVATLEEALGSLRSGFSYDLVLVDAAGDGTHSGLEVVRALRAVARDLPVVVVADRGSVDSARRAIDAGATDFLVRGEHLEERVETLLGKVGELIRLIADKRALAEQNRLLALAQREGQEILGDSPQIRALLERIERVASVPRPVLITGERGTGKELVARAIHRASGLERPIVVVNCAAFPETLLENELFGHERGAFTGAERQAPGKFELARGSSLFLDEIGFMSLTAQQKILRAVEYGSFTRVGGSREITSDARIIAATNVDLERKMAEGGFLRDLYDRLSFENLHVPPLREREGDVELLAREFLRRFMREIPAFRGKELSGQALDSLRRYPFPGNVRELKNIIERAAYRGTTDTITPGDLGLSASVPFPSAGGTWTEQIEAFKRSLLQHALEEADGNQAEAARRLGLSYHKFRYHNSRYGDSARERGNRNGASPEDV